MNDERNAPKFMLINGKHVYPTNYEHSCWFFSVILTVYSSFWSKNRGKIRHISGGNWTKMTVTFWISQTNRVEWLMLILWYHWIENTLLPSFQSSQRFFKYLWKSQLLNLPPFEWEIELSIALRVYREPVVFPGQICLPFDGTICWT